MEIFVLLGHLFYFKLEVLALDDQLVEVVGPGDEIFDSFLVFLEFLLVGVQPCIVGFFLVLGEYEGALLVFIAEVGFVFGADAAVGLLLHVVEDLLVEFLEAGSQFLVLFPDLQFVHFGVVGQFGHVLVSLGVGEVGVVDGRQRGPGPSSQTHKIINYCELCNLY